MNTGSKGPGDHVEASEANTWTGCGTIVQEVRIGKLTSGDYACSFQVSVPCRGDRKTWVRVNVFDRRLVKYVESHLRDGSEVSVVGELMNRKKAERGGPQLTEVRAFEIKVIRQE